MITDFRAKQCSLYNNKPYRDRYYEWLPYIDLTDPCSLTCKAKGLNFVAKLASSVKDGTRCRLGSLDMCVAGKCLVNESSLLTSLLVSVLLSELFFQSVGCDLRLGSLNKIDDCGICGGDGSSCRKYQHTWTHRFLSPCSRPCGGGRRPTLIPCPYAFCPYRCANFHREVSQLGHELSCGRYILQF